MAKKKTAKRASTTQTQSVRFTDRQLKVIKEAAASRGWSTSRLIQNAAIEKAAGILNFEHICRNIDKTLGMLSMLMAGMLPRVEYEGRTIEPPVFVPVIGKDEWAQWGWKQYEFPVHDERYHSETDEFHASYDVDERELIVGPPIDPGDPDARKGEVRISPRRLSSAAADELFDAIKNLGAPELGALLKRLYDQELHQSPSRTTKRKMIDPDELMAD